MSEFRYNTTGNWYKGNTHLHSTASDGGKTFAEIAQMYAAAGYHFLFRTDHWVTSDVAADRDRYPLLWLDGIEINGLDEEGSNYHVVCLGRVNGIYQGMGLRAGMVAVREQGGLLILAHPHWMGNTLDDALRHDFDGVEIYNHVCHWLNGKSFGGVHWTAMLDKKPATLALACDDAHLRTEHPGYNGGWIVVNAPECTDAAVTAAIRSGNYYSSCGPEFHALTYNPVDNTVTARTSLVQFVRLVGPTSCGRRAGTFEATSELTEATFTIPREWAWAYLEIEDHRGKRAWTNALMV